MLLASGTARPMTERPDAHRLLAHYLADVRKKPLLTPAQELALGAQKNAGAKAGFWGTTEQETGVSAACRVANVLLSAK